MVCIEKVNSDILSKWNTLDLFFLSHKQENGEYIVIIIMQYPFSEKHTFNQYTSNDRLHFTCIMSMYNEYTIYLTYGWSDFCYIGIIVKGL